mmetsp:Transcript_25762/g.29504  ORF Transcript_25762/g.29504 Transcript_25762/m.29504 type:complete len:120 (-) Transcript_25762:349-708(-)
MFSKITSTLLLLVLLACITSVTEGTLRGTIQNAVVNDRLLAEKQKIKKKDVDGKKPAKKPTNIKKGNNTDKTVKKPTKKANNTEKTAKKPAKKANNDGGETKKKKKEVEKAKNAGREMP